jgi:hypothetical protein
MRKFMPKNAGGTFVKQEASELQQTLARSGLTRYCPIEIIDQMKKEGYDRIKAWSGDGTKKENPLVLFVAFYKNSSVNVATYAIHSTWPTPSQPEPRILPPVQKLCPAGELENFVKNLPLRIEIDLIKVYDALNMKSAMRRSIFV